MLNLAKSGWIFRYVVAILRSHEWEGHKLILGKEGKKKAFDRRYLQMRVLRLKEHKV